MTPEETKAHVESRLRELGWNVHIGNAGYEKISRVTGGSESGVSQLCHKLVSLGALQDRREITDDVVEMAVLDLDRHGETRSSASAGGNGGHEVDWGSIEELAAELETKLGTMDDEPEPQAPSRRGYAGNGGNGVAPAAEPKGAAVARPKILLVDPAKDSRARFVQALSNDFRVVEAANGEEAWKALRTQTDIELLVTDLAMPKIDGYDLIKRLREATSPLNLVGMPVIVITAAENANAKMRVLMTGANDFIIKSTDPSELRARVLSRHKLNKAASRIAVAPSAGATRNTAYGSAPARPNRGTPRADGAGAPRQGARDATVARAPAATLTAEQRYGPGAAARKAGVQPRASDAKRGRPANATTTITVGATVLLVLAIAAIFYLGHDGERVRLAPEVTVVPESKPPAAEQSQRSAVPRTDNAPLSADDREPPPLAKSELPGEPKEPTTPSSPRTEPLESAPGAPAIEAPRPTAPAEPAKPQPQKASPAERSTPPESSTSVPTPLPAAPTPRPRAEEPPTPAAAPAPAAPAPSPERMEATEISPNSEELARAGPPAVVAPAPPPPNRISRDELSTFLTRFASVYEAGDLEQFIGLFAENARTNDRGNRSGIRQDYESLFRTTDLRRMKLGEISWEVDENQAEGWGEFDVTVRRRGERQPYLYTGSLTLVVEKVDGRLRIVRLYHGQRRAES